MHAQGHNVSVSVYRCRRCTLLIMWTDTEEAQTVLWFAETKQTVSAQRLGSGMNLAGNRSM